MNRQRVSRLSVMSLLIAGLWQAPSVQARASPDFLSAITGVNVPEAPAASPAPAPQSGRLTPVPATPSQEAALKSLRHESQRLKSALAKKNAELQQSATAAARDRAALMQKLAAMEKRLSWKVVTVPSPDGAQQACEQAALAQSQLADLRVQRDALQLKLRAALQVGSNAADSRIQQQTVNLQKQVSKLEAARYGLQKQLAQVNIHLQHVVSAGDKAMAQVKSLQQENVTLKNSAQQAEMAQLQVATLRDQRDDLQLKLKQALKENGDQKFALTALQAGSKTAADSTTERIAALQKENADLKTAVQTHQQAARGQATAQVEKAAASEAQLSTLRAERDDLKQRLDGLTAERAALQKNQTAPPPASTAPALKTDRQKQAYASGVVFASNLQRSLSLHRDLGVDLPASLLIAGLTDGLSDSVRLDGAALQASYGAMMKKLVAREREKYAGALKQLEKLASGSSLIKRNGTLFFVQGRKGSGKVASGERVTFDLTESAVKGKVLRAEKGVTAVVDNKLPYLVEQALTLAGRGGELIVYSMASDVYPPEQLPEGLYPYSLLKYQFRVDGATPK